MKKLLVLAATVSVVFAFPCIHFDRKLIPRIHAPLPVFVLGPPAKVPTKLLTKFVHASSPNATFKTDPCTKSQLGYDGDVLVSFVHGVTGETRVFPNLTALEPAGQKIDIGLGHRYVKNIEMFPQDSTKFAIVN